MNRSISRENAFKLIYSLEIQQSNNLEEQIELFFESNNIVDQEAKKYIKNAVLGIQSNEQEILKREKELSNSAMYSMMGDATKDLFAGIFNSPEFKEEMSKKIKEGFNKK